jgi:hypothetical protein
MKKDTKKTTTDAFPKGVQETTKEILEFHIAHARDVIATYQKMIKELQAEEGE